MRKVVAFFVAPVPVIFLLSLMLGNQPLAGRSIGAATAMLVVSWLIQLVIGLPIAVWARRMGMRRWWQFIGIGALTYGIASVVFVGIMWGRQNATPARVGGSIVIIMLIGVGAGLTSWLVLRLWRSPDLPDPLAQLSQTFD